MADAPRLIQLRSIFDPRGSITVGEQLPFPVRRFFTFDPPKYDVERGGHAHKTLKQLVCCLRGWVLATTEHEDHGARHLLADLTHALYVPPMTWLDLHLGRDAQVLVLASDEYDESDYIRSRADFAATT